MLYTGGYYDGIVRKYLDISLTSIVTLVLTTAKLWPFDQLPPSFQYRIGTERQQRCYVPHELCKILIKNEYS